MAGFDGQVHSDEWSGRWDKWLVKATCPVWGRVFIRFVPFYKIQSDLPGVGPGLKPILRVHCRCLGQALAALAAIYVMSGFRRLFKSEPLRQQVGADMGPNSPHEPRT